MENINQQQTIDSSIDFSDLNDWQPLSEVVQQYKQFTLPQINWLLRSKKTNGLDKVIKKIGKFNYAHVPAFSIWISQQ